ncbi:MAG: methyltransferase domain-containing protein [Nitrosopumilaceae archaeon]|nr:methyltransferase domain-containing protein [Nitrosopumilaceae archaeon]NIU02467.1 methyltransferase domain-containing protein [Nitrosopumilaceae archaeon]NIU88928.1 methyltransferase domain-containing protein [Nitrosopumilaceae archaeon]NIV67039.1 methyltransferase domain-containing protein [Nitrosopumilaceae archaeon]NIX63068.1 methyltransferase domain-containing protein [Nitrosopumilaceae archaeon]
MSEKWRGNSQATKKWELDEILEFLEVNNDDVFCDLGCGRGNLCIWASDKVKKSYGIEDNKDRYQKAKQKVLHRKKKNIRLIHGNYEDENTLNKIKDANIVFCINESSLSLYKKLEDALKPNTVFVKLGFPEYPVMRQSFVNDHSIIKIPFKIAKNKNQWINNVLGRKGTHKDLHKQIKKDFLKEFANEQIETIDDDIISIDWLRKKFKK